MGGGDNPSECRPASVAFRYLDESDTSSDKPIPHSGSLIDSLRGLLHRLGSVCPSRDRSYPAGPPPLPLLGRRCDEMCSAPNAGDTSQDSPEAEVLWCPKPEHILRRIYIYI